MIPYIKNGYWYVKAPDGAEVQLQPAGTNTVPAPTRKLGEEFKKEITQAGISISCGRCQATLEEMNTAGPDIVWSNIDSWAERIHDNFIRLSLLDKLKALPSGLLLAAKHHNADPLTLVRYSLETAINNTWDRPAFIVQWPTHIPTPLQYPIVTATDRAYEIGCMLLIRSIRVYHTGSITVHHLSTPSHFFLTFCLKNNVTLTLTTPPFNYRGAGWQTFGKPYYVSLHTLPVMWIDADCIVTRPLNPPCPLFVDHGYHKPNHTTRTGVCAGIFVIDDKELLHRWMHNCNLATRNPHALPYYDQGVLDQILPYPVSSGCIWSDFHEPKARHPQGMMEELYRRPSTITHLGDRHRPWQDWKYAN